MITLQGGSEWFTFPCSAHIVKARPSSRLASKPTRPDAIAVKTSSVHGGSFSCTTRTGAGTRIRRQVIDMAINGSGIRDTARVLRISPTTVIAILKKSAALRHVNPALLPSPCSRAISVPVGRAAELDEMWSFVGAKATIRWLWHATDLGRVLAFVVGPRKDVMFLKSSLYPLMIFDEQNR